MNHNFINYDFTPMQFLAHNILRGHWDVRVWENAEHYRQSRLKSCPAPIWAESLNNGITDEGIHYVLDTSFRGVAQITTWYAGLINNAGFTGVAAADTMASHTGWTESEDYDEAVRQTLAFAAAAARSISDSVSFTINTTVTIRGLFIPSNNTKGGTTGTLFSTALFATPPALVSGNVLTANYSLSD